MSAYRVVWNFGRCTSLGANISMRWVFEWRYCTRTYDPLCELRSVPRAGPTGHRRVWRRKRLAAGVDADRGLARKAGLEYTRMLSLLSVVEHAMCCRTWLLNLPEAVCLRCFVRSRRRYPATCPKDLRIKCRPFSSLEFVRNVGPIFSDWLSLFRDLFRAWGLAGSCVASRSGGMAVCRALPMVSAVFVMVSMKQRHVTAWVCIALVGNFQLAGQSLVASSGSKPFCSFSVSAIGEDLCPDKPLRPEICRCCTEPQTLKPASLPEPGGAPPERPAPATCGYVAEKPSAKKGSDPGSGSGFRIEGLLPFMIRRYQQGFMRSSGFSM